MTGFKNINLIIYILVFFLKIPIKTAVIIDPTRIDVIHINGFTTIGRINIPPCGAITSTLKSAEINPPTDEPSIHAGITLKGSAAANGITPSVIKHAPKNNKLFQILFLLLRIYF